MAKKPTKGGIEKDTPDAVALVPDDQHPEFIDGMISDAADLAAMAAMGEFTPNPTGPLPGPLPGPFPQPPLPSPIPAPFPQPLPFPFPTPIPQPVNICGPVSGRYTRVLPSSQPGPLPGPIVPGPPIFPFPPTVITVRVDVDRFFPQRRISIEARRLFPNQTSHLIAEVTSDACVGFSNRRIAARVTYRDGPASPIPGDNLIFEARRTTGRSYGAYTLTLRNGPTTVATHVLTFRSRYFDDVEFEVDRVADANPPTTTYATHSHPTRPASLANETISMATVFQRAGFNATMSPNTSVIPTSGAGANGTWSDGEMHNAMLTYWSRFANKPQWAMWVLFARQHDQGPSLGGIMFDDIGPNHRQGTAIFTDSFIQNVPAGDRNPVAWRNRMVFWTAIHEIGHGFNLAHSWQKALGNPWIPLANEPEARSFMNYPFFVSGGQSSFFSNFQFRFSDQELVFMRHAPRRFVEMGNANWFVNHGFEEAAAAAQAPHRWTLEIRPNRDISAYAFMEPVKLELKLTNVSSEPLQVDHDLLDDGKHFAVYVGREGGLTKAWSPFVTRCHETHHDTAAPGEALYGAHLIGATTNGWLIDEPGFYKVQAAIDMDGEIVVSNVLRVYVAPPASEAENRLAPDFFTEDVARVLAFEGAPELEKATDTLREVAERCAGTPVATHATVAVSTPLLRDYKTLGGDGAEMTIKGTAAKVEAAAKTQMEALVKAPDAAAETLGHIGYFGNLSKLADALEAAGDSKGAIKVLKASISTMKKRGVIKTVVSKTESKLSSLG